MDREGAAKPHDAAARRRRARDRRLSPEQLRRALRGDLDTNVLQALRQEPARRYPSVEQLAGDLQRHLRGRPVMARRDTVSYRASKLIRRNRLAVAGAAASLMLICGLVVILAVQSVRLARERDRATHERDRATRVVAMLNELFEIADPGEERGNTITARELLDRGAEHTRQLADAPDTAMLLDTLARLYDELGLYAQSIPLRQRSLMISRLAFGDHSRETAAALRNQGRALAMSGDFAAAEPLFREALATRRRLHPADHPQVLACLNDLALVCHDLGDYRRAAPLYRRALAIYRSALPAEHPLAVKVLLALARILVDGGEAAEAQELLREAVRICSRKLPAGSRLSSEAHAALDVCLAASVHRDDQQ